MAARKVKPFFAVRFSYEPVWIKNCDVETIIISTDIKDVKKYSLTAAQNVAAIAINVFKLPVTVVNQDNYA